MCVHANPCKLAKALLVTEVHPFSNLIFCNQTKVCLNPKLVIQLNSINFSRASLAQWVALVSKNIPKQKGDMCIHMMVHKNVLAHEIFLKMGHSSTKIILGFLGYMGVGFSMGDGVLDTLALYDIKCIWCSKRLIHI